MHTETRGRRQRTGREPWGQVPVPDIWRIKVGKYSINDEVRWNKAHVLLSCFAVADFPGAPMASVAHSSITLTMQHLHHTRIFFWAHDDAQGKSLPYNYSEQVSYTQHHWLFESFHPLLGKGVFYRVGCLAAPLTCLLGISSPFHFSSNNFQHLQQKHWNRTTENHSSQFSWKK